MTDYAGDMLYNYNIAEIVKYLNNTDAKIIEREYENFKILDDEGDLQ
jgi:hypothetical protein